MEEKIGTQDKIELNSKTSKNKPLNNKAENKKQLNHN